MQFFKDFFKSFTWFAIAFLIIEYGMYFIMGEEHLSPWKIILYAAVISLLLNAFVRVYSGQHEKDE